MIEKLAAGISNVPAHSRDRGPAARGTRMDAYRRRNLRIAIRQLERAELYLVALYSLDMDDEGVERRVDGLVGELRSLRHDLLLTKQSA